jgi:excisionase family DNA binding protein
MDYLSAIATISKYTGYTELLTFSTGVYKLRGVNNDLITVSEAARRKGCHRSWIHYLIKEGRLKATQIGPVFLVRPNDLEKCKVRPRTKPNKNGHTSSVSRKKQTGTKTKASPLSRTRRGR